MLRYRSEEMVLKNFLNNTRYVLINEKIYFLNREEELCSSA